jgi:hypothetical protein
MILVLDLVHWMWVRIINFKIQFKRLVEYIPKRYKYHVHKVRVISFFKGNSPKGVEDGNEKSTGVVE